MVSGVRAYLPPPPSTIETGLWHSCLPETQAYIVRRGKANVGVGIKGKIKRENVYPNPFT